MEELMVKESGVRLRRRSMAVRYVNLDHDVPLLPAPGQRDRETPDPHATGISNHQETK